MCGVPVDVGMSMGVVRDPSTFVYLSCLLGGFAPSSELDLGSPRDYKK
jgi:hypothetical protein